MPTDPNDTALVTLAINPGTRDFTLPSADELRALGAPWIRFLLYNEFQNVQTGQNTDLDYVLNLYRDLGISVLVLVNHETVGALPPPHGDLGWGDANSGYIGRVADVSQKIAAFYGGRIGAIEIFNEPDVTQIVPEDYAAMLQAAFNKIRAVSRVTVISAGICCGQAFDYLKRVLIAAPDACDFVGWHTYAQRVDGFPAPSWGVGELRDSIIRARALAGKPLWITEIGADLHYSWPSVLSPEASVAEYLTRAYSLMRELGRDMVAHAFWFAWKELDFGLVDNAGNRRRAWFAFQQQAQFVAPSSVSILDVQLTPASLQANQLLNVAITVKNNTSNPIQTQSPDPGFVYDEDDTFYTRNFPEINGAYRVGIDFDGRTGVDHPYRWGFGAPLAPGETRVVTGAIRLKYAQSKKYWAGLVQEQIAWLDDHKGDALISVSAAPSAPPRITDVKFMPAVLAGNHVLTVNITLRNDSNESIQTQGPDPGFIYAEGDTFYTRGFPDVKGAYRVGVDFEGGAGIDHPYRWGLGSPLAPGESRTISGLILLRTPQSKKYWAGLVQEQIALTQDNQGTQSISVIALGEPHIVAVNFSPTRLNAGDTLNVNITIKNNSSATLATQGPDPGFVYVEGDTFYMRGFPDVNGAFRVAVDFDARTGVDHPYRWGLGSPLAPGEARTITGAIKLTRAQAQNFWAGLVQEQIAWMYDRVGATSIQVT